MGLLNICLLETQILVIFRLQLLKKLKNIRQRKYTSTENILVLHCCRKLFASFCYSDDSTYEMYSMKVKHEMQLPFVVGRG